MSELSPSLQRNPDLDSWVRIDDGGTVTLFTGKVELGQGVRTAISRIGAEELDVSLARIRVQTADTAPRFAVVDTDYGVLIGARRSRSDGQHYWRITQYLMPFHTMPPTDADGRIVRGCVVCPWHGYEYRPDTGASPPPFTEKVPTFRVRIEDGRVLVHPQPLPPGTFVDPARMP